MVISVHVIIRLLVKGLLKLVQAGPPCDPSQLKSQTTRCSCVDHHSQFFKMPHRNHLVLPSTVYAL